MLGSQRKKGKITALVDSDNIHCLMIGTSVVGKTAFFYDSVVGLLTAVILLLAEFLPLREIDGQPRERRHIVSVFKLVQNLLEPSGSKGKSCFQELEAAIIQRFWTEPEAEKSPPSTQRTGWTER